MKKPLWYYCVCKHYNRRDFNLFFIEERMQQVLKKGLYPFSSVLLSWTSISQCSGAKCIVSHIMSHFSTNGQTDGQSARHPLSVAYWLVQCLSLTKFDIEKRAQLIET